MSLNQRRKLHYSKSNSNWTKTIRTVIAPPYLDDYISLNPGSGEAEFKSYMKYVEDQRLPRGSKGSRPLQDIAIEVFMRKLSEVDDLGDFPKHLAKRLWDTLRKRCTLSFHCWKILSKTLRQESGATFGMLRYREVIRSPSSPLHVYTEPLTSKSFDFIASLSITVEFPVPDLVKLASIMNLGILELINPGGTGLCEPCRTSFSGVGDILVRAWSREAVENRAFTVLRILRLWNYKDVTNNSLQYLRNFPALGIFDVRDCGINKEMGVAHKAEILGWKTYGDTTMPVHEVVYDAIAYESLQKANGLYRSSEMLWDGGKVWRQERSAVSPHSVSSENFIGNGVVDDFKGTLSNSHWPEYVNEVAKEDEIWTSVEWNLFCSVRDREGWEFRNVSCWARLGEIRDDTDLVMAGVKSIEEQTFVGDFLVSPVAMACICLGERPPSFKYRPDELRNADWTHGHNSFKGGLTFLRMRISPSSASLLRPDEAGAPKRNTMGIGGIRPLKKQKQKLGDLLRAFNHG